MHLRELPIGEGVDQHEDRSTYHTPLLALLAQQPRRGTRQRRATRRRTSHAGASESRCDGSKTGGRLRHKEPYWAVDPAGIEAYEAVLTSLRTTEDATVYDWCDADPAEYRIGLDAVTADE